MHVMWARSVRGGVLWLMAGGGKGVKITIPADSLYQPLLLTAEKKFWRCVESGEPPRVFGIEPPRVRIEAVRVVDMCSSHSSAEFAGTFLRAPQAHGEHPRSQADLQGPRPEHANAGLRH